MSNTNNEASKSSHGSIDMNADMEYFKNKLLKAIDEKKYDKAERLLKQLKIMDDAIVVYRITRNRKEKQS